MSWGGAEREGDTELEAGSRHWVVSTEPDMGLELTNCELMTWAKVPCLTDWATQARPKCFPIFKKCLFIFERASETERKQGRDSKRGTHKIWSRLPAPSCQHRAWRGAWTHKPWDHDLSQSRMLNRLSHSGVPILWLLCDPKLHFWHKPIFASTILFFS